MGANTLILPLKVIFMILQFFLVGIILYTRVRFSSPLSLTYLRCLVQDEYIYISIKHNNRAGPDSDEYHEAYVAILIAACIYFGLLVLELFTLAFGLSVMFKQVNAMQVLLHGMGVMGNVWMVLDRWHWIQLYVMAFFFAMIPFILEISVMFAARSQMNQMTLMRTKQETELRKAYEKSQAAIVPPPALAAAQ